MRDVARLIYRVGLVVGGLMLVLVATTRLAGGGQGDAARGADIFESNIVVCFACHSNGVSGPMMVNVRVLVRDMRLQAPENGAKTPEQFLAESIWYHDAYTGRDYRTHVTPTVYTKLLNLRDVQDLVAYLLTL